MHIRLLIANAYVGGGTARTISSTASALVRRGHDVEVVSLLRRRRDPTFPMDPRVRLYPLVDEFRRDREDPPRHALERAGRALRGVANAQPSVAGHVLDRRTAEWSLYTDAVLIRWLRAQRGGVIVGTRPALNLAVARFARRGIVRVGQDHMNLGTYKPALRRSLRRWYPRGLDALVTLTERDADQYAALLGGRTRVLSIPNGVPDVGGHRAALDSRLVVAAGRLTPQKGYDRLLPVWKDVVAQRPDWRLQIYGGGAKEAALRAQIAQLGIGDSAQLMGRTDELFARMAEASLFVMTSRKEGLPMVLLEAMGIGLPVVAYDCPTGPREVISDGVDGYLVRNGDRKALAARMIQLMDDADERRRLGRAGLEKAARFDLDHLAERWERLFAELAEAKRG